MTVSNRRAAGASVSLAPCIATFLVLWVSTAGAMSLEQAVSIAQQQDPWLQASVYRQDALHAMSEAAATLDDPVISLGVANLPTDTFDFNQEAMTQFQIGISQTLPRGESRALERERLQWIGSQQPLMRADRKAKVAVIVSHLWLEAYRAGQTIRLIESDRELFEHLVDVAESNYSSAIGKTRQQDLIRAQLELTQLEDRLNLLHEQLDVAASQLGEWLLTAPEQADGYSNDDKLSRTALPQELPAIDLAGVLSQRDPADLTTQDVADSIIQHPAILALDAQITASATAVRIAEERYKPQWQLRASYGYRDDAPNGLDRADFFSVGVAFDVPLFTDNRQDQTVRSRSASTQEMRTKRALLLRSMMAGVATQRSRLAKLEQRGTLYKTRLLQETHEQAQAALAAYTHDDGDFAEVVRARIAGLNADIEALNIEIDRLKTLAQLNYFFTTSQPVHKGETP